MRDFNMTRFMDERQGCEGNIVNIDSFNDLIWGLGLNNIPFGGEVIYLVQQACNVRLCEA